MRCWRRASWLFADVYRRETECPLLAKSRHSERCARTSALPPKADISLSQVICFGVSRQVRPDLVQHRPLLRGQVRTVVHGAIPNSLPLEQAHLPRLAAPGKSGSLHSRRDRSIRRGRKPSDRASLICTRSEGVYLHANSVGICNLGKLVHPTRCSRTAYDSSSKDGSWLRNCVQALAWRQLVGACFILHDGSDGLDGRDSALISRLR